MLKKASPPKRSASFVPQLLIHLSTYDKFTCKFSELPASYRSQPYNLPAKLLKRGGIDARVVFNKTNDMFSIIKFGIKPMPETKKKPAKKTKHVR
jgi:hypothetical protein